MAITFKTEDLYSWYFKCSGIYLWSNDQSVKISDKQSDVILVFLHESVSKENCIKLKCDPDEIEYYIQIIEKQIQKEDMLI